MRILFVNGTDTSVGKTAVTSLIAAYLVDTDANLRAIKPFCSGDRTDALLLRELQGNRLSLEEINPFYFEKPLSPWTAGRGMGRSVTLHETVHYLQQHARACELLLVEGAGGLLSPLGEKFNAADLMVQLGAECLLVAANRLGVLNHTLLTVEALSHRKLNNVRIALVNGGVADPAAPTNEEDLRMLLPQIPLFRIPFIPDYRPEGEFIRATARGLREVLQKLILSFSFDFAKVSPKKDI